MVPNTHTLVHWGRPCSERALQCTKCCDEASLPSSGTGEQAPFSLVGSWGWVPMSKAFVESFCHETIGRPSGVFEVGRGVSHLYIGPWIFRWLGVKGAIVCHSESWKKKAKLHLSPCQAAVGFAVLLLPRPLFLTLSKQLEQILFYWGFYQVQEIPAAPAPRHFLSLCGVLRCHPTRPVRSREFALSASNWILNQALERLRSLQPVLWHFKWADKSIFTSGMQTADLTQWKLVCESVFSRTAYQAELLVWIWWIFTLPPCRYGPDIS